MKYFSPKRALKLKMILKFPRTDFTGLPMNIFNSLVAETISITLDVEIKT